MNKPIGPSVRKLIIRKMSQDAIPDGGGVADVLNFLRGNLSKSVKDATEWVLAAIDAVKKAPDNPYGDDDEQIAQEILRRIEKE